MASNTRERLTRAAIDRFYRDGFRNVGIDQILEDVGISKTAFYKHFTCKEELMLAALEMQNEWLQQAFRGMIREQGGRAATSVARGFQWRGARSQVARSGVRFSSGMGRSVGPLSATGSPGVAARRCDE